MVRHEDLMKKKANFLQMCIASCSQFSGFKDHYIFHYVKLNGRADGTDEKGTKIFPPFCKKCYNDGMNQSLKKIDKEVNTDLCKKRMPSRTNACKIGTSLKV